MSVRKRIRRHAIDITVILVAVMFVVGIVEVYLDPQLQYVRANNATSLKFTINSASPNLQQFDPSPLIEVATGSLATILAIVFGLSQILVSDATKQYGPRMAEILRTARRYWFAIAVYSIATVTLLSSLALVHGSASIGRRSYESDYPRRRTGKFYHISRFVRSRFDNLSEVIIKLPIHKR